MPIINLFFIYLNYCVCNFNLRDLLKFCLTQIGWFLFLNSNLSNHKDMINLKKEADPGVN